MLYGIKKSLGMGLVTAALKQSIDPDTWKVHRNHRKEPG